MKPDFRSFRCFRCFRCHFFLDSSRCRVALNLGVVFAIQFNFWARYALTQTVDNHTGSHMEGGSVSEEFFRFRYMNKFKCIGSDCPDLCCRGWEVPVDAKQYFSLNILACSKHIDRSLCLMCPSKIWFHSINVQIGTLSPTG